MNITEILADPDKIKSLNDEALGKLLAPYIPLTRQAVLPDDKPEKIGLELKLVRSLLAQQKGK